MEKILMNPDNDLKYRDGLYPTEVDQKKKKTNTDNTIEEQVDKSEEKLEYFTE